MPSKRRGECGECGRIGKLLARGLCGACYQRRWKTGQVMPPLVNPTFEELFALASEGRSEDECWPWPGTISPTGYPTSAAYRKVWVRLHGPVPRRGGKTLNIDHRCHSESDCQRGAGCPHRRCVNPRHLRLLTWEDNVALSSPKPMCDRGLHAYVPREERSWPQKGCPDCYREYQARYRAAHRRELAAAQRARNARKRAEASS